MDYWTVNLAPRRDRDFCFLGRGPSDEDDLQAWMSMGRSVAASYGDPLEFHFEEHSPGMQLPSLLGNTRSLFMVARAVKDAIAALSTGPIEFLPFVLFNHKGRLASRDYFIVNPLGSFDAIDPDRSVIERRATGSVRLKGLPVLRRDKLDQAPDLFRIPENLFDHVVSDRFIDALRPLKPTNVLLTKLQVSG